MKDYTNSIKVYECFQSVQGEGSTIGTPAYFLRTAGCNLQCPWCDTKYAIDPNSSVSKFIPIKSLAGDINATGLDNVVYTGGEPLIQWKQLFKLSEELRPGITSIIIETNGTRFPPLDESLTKMFFVVSPKFYDSVSSSSRTVTKILKAYYFNVELKIVFLNDTDIERAYVLLNRLHEDRIPILKPVTFQPGVYPNTKNHQSLHDQWQRAYELYESWRTEIPYKTKFIVQQHKAIWHPGTRGV